ncbi:MAG: porin, partial [Gallionella sp.]|nr:porin [Gallionella sp.]
HHLGSSGTGTLAPIAGLENLSERAWKLGVSYAFDSFTLYGVYERTADNLGGVLGLPARSNLLGHRSYYLAGKYRLGDDTIKAAYTNAGELNMNGGGQNTGAQQWSLGYDHKLSRRTSVYALYTRLNNDSGVSFNLAPTDASTGSASASAAGADPSAFSVGMRHTF